jgi:hypothetical protein
MSAIFASMLAVRRVAAPRRSVKAADSSTGGMIGQAKKKMWLPGVENPPYLDGTLPGDYGAQLN